MAAPFLVSVGFKYGARIPRRKNFEPSPSGQGYNRRLSELSHETKFEVRRRADIQGPDIARPAEFLLDASGSVRWVNLSKTCAFGPDQTYLEVDETRLASASGPPSTWCNQL